MFQCRAEIARRAALALMLFLPMASCGKTDSATSSADIAETTETAEPTLFDTTLDFAAYGNAAVTAIGSDIRIALPGGGEGGVSLALKPTLTADTVATFSLDAQAPLNFRLTRTDGTIDYLSTEGRGHVVLGPSSASEALIYTGEAGSLTLSVASVQPCGGSLVCQPDGSLTIRIGDAGATTTLLAKAYGAAGLSHPDTASISAIRGGPAGEYGFSLAREADSADPLLIEFSVEAAQPINVLIQNGEQRDYISSNQGWIRLDPGSTALAYTPGPGTFSFHDFRVSVCTPDEQRCVPAPPN